MNDKYVELLQKSAQKDQNAFKQLYDQTSPMLYSMVLRLVRKESIAEELLQEAYLSIWQKADSFDPEKGKALTWLCTIAQNKALDKLRATKTRPQYSTSDFDISTCVSPDLAPEIQVSLGNEVKKLLPTLKAMHPEQRETLLQFFYYGMTQAELAKRMNKPLGTIKSWIRRGKYQLCEI